jgi:hypothetical protein
MSELQDTDLDLQEIYKLFDDHCGTWQGTYARTNAAGILVDCHMSLLEMQRTDNQWRQKNVYTWQDGRTQTFEFEGTFNADGKLVFDTRLLIGKAWKTGPTILMQWEYQYGMSNQNFEQINLLAAGKRMRSWQLSILGNPTGYVLIAEEQTSKECPSFA